MISISTLFSPVTKLALLSKEGTLYLASDLKNGATGLKNYIVKNRGIDSFDKAEIDELKSTVEHLSSELTKLQESQREIAS